MVRSELIKRVQRFPQFDRWGEYLGYRASSFSSRARPYELELLGARSYPLLDLLHLDSVLAEERECGTLRHWALLHGQPFPTCGGWHFHQCARFCRSSAVIAEAMSAR